jgi:hypothetical protein
MPNLTEGSDELKGEESREGNLGGESYFVSLALGWFWGKGKRTVDAVEQRKTIMISSESDKKKKSEDTKRGTDKSWIPFFLTEYL